MKRYCCFTSMLAMALSPLFCAGEITISDSIITFSTSLMSGSTSQSTLFRSDGTYQDLRAYNYNSGLKVKWSEPLGRGNYDFTYDFATDPLFPSSTILIDQVTITFLSGSSQGIRLLIFSDALSGKFRYGAYPTAGSRWFRMFPRIVTDDLENVSNRAWVDPKRIAISGFIIDGANERWVLIRGAGPALANFGVPQVVQSPRLRIFQGGSLYVELGSWSADVNLLDGLNASFEIANAFPFPDGSADCAIVMPLEPGSYTVHAESEDQSGEILTEVYLLPYGG